MVYDDKIIELEINKAILTKKIELLEKLVASKRNIERHRKTKKHLKLMNTPQR